MNNNLPNLLIVGDWNLDCQQNTIWRDKRKIRLEPKTMMILQYLASRPNEVVSREELFEVFWPKQVVTDDALNRVMSSLRRTFKDDFNSPEYISTIRTVGYKLVAPVEVLDSPIVNHQSSQNERASQSSAPGLSSIGVISSLASRFFSRQFLMLVLVTFMLLFSLNYGVTDNPKKIEISSKNRITYDKQQNLMPAFSNDGNWLSYIEKLKNDENNLVLRQLNTKYAVPIGEPGYRYFHPVFSPDDKQIAVVIQQDKQPEQSLAIVDLESRKHSLLTPLKSSSQGLSWHPNANFIAYSQPHNNQLNNGIYLWDMQTQQQRLLTPSTLGANDHSPMFSPNGKVVAFIRSSAYKESAIYTSDFAGNVKQITSQLTDVSGFDWLDDETIVFLSQQGLYQQTLLGSAQKIDIGNADENYYGLRVNRSKNQLLMSAKRERHQSQVINLYANDTLFPLTESQTNDVESAISQNGLNMAFVSNRTGNNLLWIRTGNSLLDIANTQFDAIYDLIWSPDSSSLAAVVKNQGQYGILNYQVLTSELDIHWLDSASINLSGWKDNESIVFSHYQPANNNWWLKVHNSSSQLVSTLSHTDIYQSRITPNKKHLLFINSARNELWKWNWDDLPIKVVHSENLDLIRNWDVDDNDLYGINNSGSIFRFNIKNGQTKAVYNASWSRKFRPQALIYGVAGTEKIMSENDLWLATFEPNH